MNKNILLFSTQGISVLHFGQELEIINKYKNEGYKITIVACNNVLNSCYFNPCHNLLACAMCEGRRAYWHHKLEVDKGTIFLKQYNPKVNIETVNDLDTLVMLDYKGINIGRGVASSTISLLRDYEIDLTIQKHFDIVQELSNMAANVVENFKKILKQNTYGKVIIFNGRFAEHNPVLNICHTRNIEFECYESGSSNQKYQLFKNSLPHSISFRANMINQLWESSINTNKVQLSQDWYIERRNRNDKKEKAFTENQTIGLLPDNFDSNKVNITIYNSSEDEMKVIEEFSTPLYENQNEAIKIIINHYSDNNNIHFYLRCHPNLAKVENTQINEIRSWGFRNLTVIDPLSKVDTYYIMEQSDRVITFGSTMGIETTFWNRVSLLIGNTFYQNLDAVYRAESYDELYTYIEDENLIPKPKQNTYPYGYFNVLFGTHYSNFIYKNKYEGYFYNEKIKKVYPKSIFKLFTYLNNFSSWRKLTKLLLNQPLTIRNFTKLKSNFEKGQ